ncbi:MAG: dephospho-CoA kinase [Pseudomonadota bacterium]
MTFKLGLTGSIGMGKSTTAAMFAQAGCDVWDADAAVHRLYASGGQAVEPMKALLPEVVVDGGVSRELLRHEIAKDAGVLKAIEAIVHPLVAQDRQIFIDSATADILVFDIPLLFETGGDGRMDAVAVVSIPADVQKARVLARGLMSEEQFEIIRAKQMPNEEKVRRADYVIVTDTVDHARMQVQNILASIREQRDA